MTDFLVEKGSDNNPGRSISPDNVHTVETELSRMRPRTPEYDELLLRYFQFLDNQLQVMISGDRDTLSFPLTMYDKTASDVDALRGLVIEVGQAHRSAIKDRGRGDHSQVGDHFWYGSETLQDENNRLGQALSEAQQKLKIDPETWYRKVLKG